MKILRNLLFGFLTWLIPFIFSFFFYSKTGELSIDIMFFKTIMIVIGSLTGSFFLILMFKKIEKDFLKQGILIGLFWFSINIILDLLILVPMSKMNISDYFLQIGLRYLMIVFFSISIGYLIEMKKK